MTSLRERIEALKRYVPYDIVRRPSTYEYLDFEDVEEVLALLEAEQGTSADAEVMTISDLLQPAIREAEQTTTRQEPDSPLVQKEP